jgi:purine-binding chemotaxis protein CheW
MKLNGETTLSTIPRVRRHVQTRALGSKSRVDWDLIHRKVLEGSARLAWVEEATQEVLEQTWARRADQMARVIEEEEAEEQIQVVPIRLGYEVYGLETNYVFDIRPLDNITPVPRVPNWVAGVTNLRGRVVSVLDLAVFFGLPPVEVDNNHKPTKQNLIVVETPAMEIALVADEVLMIESLPLSKIQEATSAVRGIPPKYMRGIVVQGDKVASHEQIEAPHSPGDPNTANPHAGGSTGLILILDLLALLADKRLIVHEDII